MTDCIRLALKGASICADIGGKSFAAWLKWIYNWLYKIGFKGRFDCVDIGGKSFAARLK